MYLRVWNKMRPLEVIGFDRAYSCLHQGSTWPFRASPKTGGCPDTSTASLQVSPRDLLDIVTLLQRDLFTVEGNSRGF